MNVYQLHVRKNQPRRHLRTLAVLACGAIAAACGGTEPSNTPPAAAFTVECGQLVCLFANASTDADGTIAASAWKFGDGATSADASPAHTYAAPGGSFIVTVVVTDDDGAADTLSRKLTVTDAGVTVDDGAPVAAFAFSCTGLACQFTDQSTDPDEGDSVVVRTWNFGDGQTSTLPSPYHTYAAPGGQFTVTLTVKDRREKTGSISHAVNALRADAPDRSGTYPRESPHGQGTGDSRFVVRADGTFDYVEDGSSGQKTLTGHWRFATSWGGWAIQPGDVLLMDFDAIPADEWCGEAFGVFLMDGQLAVSYCRPVIEAGLEEGLYASTPVVVPDVPPPQVGQIAFSRDGKIYRANTDGTGVVQLSTGPGDGEPAWSPDGSRIAFSRGGVAGGIYVMGADGASPVLRASGGGSPTWSPDGQWVAFACRIGSDGGICKVRADDDGSAPATVLSRMGAASFPAWSPDGTRIAFISDWNMFDIWFDTWVVSPDGSSPTVLREHTPLTPNPYDQHEPAWSPDGRRIAVMECPWSWYGCSSSAIAVMNADGSGLVRVAVASGWAPPTWSPDGQVIAFASAGSIEWVSADGSQRGRIIANGSSPAWRPAH